MKKYFAKYLPVEGEIKEGISVKEKYSINPKIVEVIAVNEDGMINCKGENLWYVPEALQKVKLFLCSRDIQIGDKYYHNEYYPYPTGNIANTNSKVMDAHMMVANEGENYEGDWAYKVLGQISSDATWVKEGDEFDKNEVKPLWYKKLNDKGGFEWRSEILQPDNPLCYGIKGPCGHFH